MLLPACPGNAVSLQGGAARLSPLRAPVPAAPPLPRCHPPVPPPWWEHRDTAGMPSIPSMPPAAPGGEICNHRPQPSSADSTYGTDGLPDSLAAASWTCKKTGFFLSCGTSYIFIWLLSVGTIKDLPSQTAIPPNQELLQTKKLSELSSTHTRTRKPSRAVKH